MAENMPGAPATRSATASVSAGIAAANAHPAAPSDPGPRFPGEDGGRSLAEMAQVDLDAALQLLAERAHYITAASGAAIALRRGEHHDMLCRASAGSNAPGLGAILSMDYGLSGESVRTRQLLRCDDADRDPRANHEVCRHLGIASVVVMPIVSDDQVLGVFELLSGTTRAFGERDLSALRRLSEMVETAVKHAIAAQTPPPASPPQPALEVEGAIVAEPEPAPEASVKTPPVHDTDDDILDDDILMDVPSAPPQVSATPELKRQEIKVADIKEAKSSQPAPLPKKPLFWSAAAQTPTNSPPTVEPAPSVAVPPVLRNLQKCQACGFPVSQGRKYCVECEEKQWRGQPLTQPSDATTTAHREAPSRVMETRNTSESADADPEIRVLADLSHVQPELQPHSGSNAAPASNAAPSAPQKSIADATPPQAIAVHAPTALSTPEIKTVLPSEQLTPARPFEDSPVLDAPPLDNTLFLTSSTQSESWFASNKYILIVLAAVAIIIAVIVLLR